MFKPGNQQLKRLEQIFEEAGYKIRYEKGNFQSGHCLVHDRQVIVINKYFDPESRFYKLIDIWEEIQVDSSKITEKNRKYISNIIKDIESKVGADIG